MNTSDSPGRPCMSDGNIDNLPCLNVLNRSEMPDLPSTTEQENLYNGWKTFDLYVGSVRMHVRGSEDALSGKFVGRCPVYMRLDGGGWTCGHPEAVFWYRPHQKALQRPGMFIFSRYAELLPHNDSEDMTKGHNKFFECFTSQNIGKVADAIKKIYTSMTASLQSEILLVAESAGCHYGVMSLFYPGLHVVSVELLYPMVQPYERELSLYRGYKPTAQELVEGALVWCDDASKVRGRHVSGQGRMPPKGMASLPLNAVRTRIQEGDIRQVGIWEMLLGPHYHSLANMMEVEHHTSVVGPELILEPGRIAKTLGKRLKNLGLEYLPDVDALRFKKDRELLKAGKLQENLTVLIVQGLEDVNVSPEGARQLQRFLSRAGANCRLYEVPDAPHAFDVPAVGWDSTTGFNWDGFHSRSINAMPWSGLV